MLFFCKKLYCEKNRIEGGAKLGKSYFVKRQSQVDNRSLIDLSATNVIVRLGTVPGIS